MPFVGCIEFCGHELVFGTASQWGGGSRGTGTTWLPVGREERCLVNMLSGCRAIDGWIGRWCIDCRMLIIAYISKQSRCQMR